MNIDSFLTFGYSIMYYTNSEAIKFVETFFKFI